MITGKRILLISPQSWGKMFVAKHHYAVELAKSGNEVYFLNPPSFKFPGSVQTAAIPAYPGLFLVNHQLFFPDVIRFKFRKLYDALMKLHVKKLVKKLGRRFDMVWCFEPNLYSSLEWFGAAVKIYHPVDELFYHYQLWPGRKADLIISVTKEILSKFENLPVKKQLINHGISTAFRDASARQVWTKGSSMAVGYSGNLLRPDIDFATLKECIRRLPSVTFIFWGNYVMKESNLAGSENDDVREFIQFLKDSKNVSLRGQTTQEELIKQYNHADVFIICYDINKDQSRGTNYHKVIEFLSTGRTVVSNNITAYAGSDLLRMCGSRSSNNEFAALLEDTINNIELHNSLEKQQLRKRFASQNTYDQHILKIAELLENGKN